MPIEKINAELCIACGACVNACPADVIRLRDGKAYAAYTRDCIACYNCELACPQKAIFVTPQRGRPAPHAW